MTPLELAADVARRLDRLHIPYVIGGSLAATLVGEPRSTADVDIAVELSVATIEPLVDEMAADFYVPEAAVAAAVASRSSFNLVDRRSALKVDVFVLGDDLLDRRQLERRRSVPLPVDPPQAVWVTSTEDVVLRELRWFDDGGRVSDRQWRDILGVLRTQAGRVDDDYLDSTARQVGLADLLGRARRDAHQYLRLALIDLATRPEAGDLAQRIADRKHRTGSSVSTEHILGYLDAGRR